MQTQSTIGDQQLHKIADFINISSYLALPFLNAFIPTFSIPQLIDGVQIKQASFTASDNYLYLTFSPVYVGFTEIWAQKLREKLAETKEVAIME